jgi:hypothetical protein
MNEFDKLTNEATEDLSLLLLLQEAIRAQIVLERVVFKALFESYL